MPNKEQKVKVLMETTQRADGQTDRQSLTYEGTFYQKDQSAHLIYKEEGSTAHIRIGEGEVHVHRLGSLSGDLWFVRGDERDSRYETPYGRMILTVATDSLDWNPLKKQLLIRYRLLAGDQLLSENEMMIKMEDIEENEKSC